MFRDHNFQVLMLGERGVGKTSLVTRYVEKTFYEDTRFNPVDIWRVKSLNCDGVLVSMELWVIPGDRVTPEVLSRANGIILCYNISDKESFNCLSYWHSQVEMYCSDMVCKVLVGTQSDKERQVDTAQAQDLADTINISHVETSSKNNVNVRQAFLFMVKELLNNEYPWGKFSNMTIRLDTDPPLEGATTYQPDTRDTASITSLVSREENEGESCCVII